MYGLRTMVWFDRKVVFTLERAARRKAESLTEEDATLKVATSSSDEAQD
jgi:hypothetical protein